MMWLRSFDFHLNFSIDLAFFHKKWENNQHFEENYDFSVIPSIWACEFVYFGFNWIGVTKEQTA